VKSKFSAAEWVDLQVMALWVLIRVASADGAMSANEWKRMLAILKNFSTADTLIGQLTRSITYAKLPKLEGLTPNFRKRIPAVRAMLIERLGAADHGLLVAGLMAMAVQVAQVEGRTDPRLANSISLEEQDVLLKLAADLS